MSMRRNTGRDRRAVAAPRATRTPLQIATTIGWWDLNGTVGVTGALIDTVADKTGNGYTLASSGANRLTLEANGLGTRSVALANGSSLYARVLGPAQSSDPIWVCAVVKVRTSATANNNIVGHNLIGSSKGMALWGSDGSGNRCLRVEGIANFGDGPNNITDWEIWTAYLTGAAANMTRVFRVNGVEQFSTGSTNYARTNGSQYLQIGDANATSKQFRVAEWACGHGTTTANEMLMLERYFAAGAGISVP